MIRFESERSMEKFICDNPRMFYPAIGTPRFKYKRQVHIENGGIADIVAITKDCIYIFELKNRPIEIKDFEQIARYIFWMKDLLSHKYSKARRVHGVLLGVGAPECMYDLSEMMCIVEGNVSLGNIALSTDGVYLEVF